MSILFMDGDPRVQDEPEPEQFKAGTMDKG